MYNPVVGGSQNVTCRCGDIELRIEGPPIAHVCCYCDDCQAAARLVDAMPNGRSGILDDAGTPNVLFRRDQLRFVRGMEKLDEFRVRNDSKTIRLVARCCNTAITQRHEQGWPHRGVKAHLIPSPPALEMRIYTRFAPDPARVPRDVPIKRGPGLTLVWRLLRAKLALGRTPLLEP